MPSLDVADYSQKISESFKKIIFYLGCSNGTGSGSDLCNDLWSRHLVLFGELTILKFSLYTLLHPSDL